MRKAALRNLGCKVNFYETEAMTQLLEEAGYEIVDFEDMADVYVVNTCSVTNIADRKSRQMLHRAKRRNHDSVVVAVGCYAQAAGDRLKEDWAVDIIVGNDRKTELVKILEEYFGGRELKREEYLIDISRAKEYERLGIKRGSEHTRAFIKIQDGCNQFCSYCVIPYTRGRIRSRRPEEILKEARGLVDLGYMEIVLTGIHLSSYGEDLSEKEPLLGLMARLDGIEGLKRIRLGSLEPRIITEEFVKGLAQLGTLCPHFHLSLQSGSDEVLKRMNRHYTREEFKRGCELLRTWFDNPAITTDVIVGFPQETVREFGETVALVRDIRFYELHVFKFSKREGTRAADMDGQVGEPIKSARSDILLKIGRELSLEYRKSLIGQTREVLMEEKMIVDGTEYLIGHTKEYVKAAVLWDESLKGKMVTGVLKGMLTDEVALLEEA
ncbi:MAG: tRNA (N(6)-L-threonylcarbamoyladenosine(37)-C(2))-methylthiotransferase MtaB [Hungatella sp.]|nr:tRNA (N(6)-L-threonylcarbamoyladenosine(37)-C(2))-methylthiotransferase MtaB [Hungatella sp.]